MIAPCVAVEPSHGEFRQNPFFIGTSFDYVILVNTIIDFPIPKGNAAQLCPAAISFNKQDVTCLQFQGRHIRIGYINCFDLIEDKSATLNIRHTKIGTGMQPWPISRAFL